MDSVDRALLAGLRETARRVGGTVAPVDVERIGGVLDIPCVTMFDRVELLHEKGHVDLPDGLGGPIRPRGLGVRRATAGVDGDPRGVIPGGLDEAALARLIRLVIDLEDASSAADGTCTLAAERAVEAARDLVRAAPMAPPETLERRAWQTALTIGAAAQTVDAATDLGAALRRADRMIAGLFHSGAQQSAAKGLSRGQT